VEHGPRLEMPVGESPALGPSRGKTFYEAAPVKAVAAGRTGLVRM
jgi:hypothetical protein